MTTLTSLTLTELLASWTEANNAVRQAEIERHSIEAEIKARMHEQRIEIAEGENVTATYRASTDWDREALKAIKEHLDPAEYALLLTRPREPEVDVRKAQALAKRVGGEVRAIVERAARPGFPKLTIERRD